MKFLHFLYFCGHFFALLDPDSADQNQCRHILRLLSCRKCQKFSFSVLLLKNVSCCCRHLRTTSSAEWRPLWREGTRTPPETEPKQTASQAVSWSVVRTWQIPASNIAQLVANHQLICQQLVCQLTPFSVSGWCVPDQCVPEHSVWDFKSLVFLSPGRCVPERCVPTLGSYFGIG